ncbi:MAG TPA: tRNA (adenosine(37)-N6)-threonylcarbamoyltransferase complex dimerization subunit type 1 TsaB [Steroidobacteraceae bacterium]|nr:tRNA (adenosine(37)-N6)-threonylcarbamoyltransferase complex dimerization subunit type 1 TsaB [Steroidobacteraceae bacterium]
MRILALDTATEGCSAALLLDGQLHERAQRAERAHAELILPMVDGLLRESRVTLREIDAIAFGRGPGAFTGVRLAASVAQGLAFGAALPVVPVSDLRALAQRALDEDRAIARVVACADARMREVYWGCFERSREGLAALVDAERVSSPQAVRLPAAWLSPGRADRLTGVGSGFGAYPELGVELSLGLVLEGFLPRAAEIARLAVPEVAARRYFLPEQALPVYLRDDVVKGTSGPS